jgi:diaminopimelate epimerase
MRFDFHKMHGLGNDFVVIDARAVPVPIDEATARRVADRHQGIGCDQLIVISPSVGADLHMRIWNADGSEVAACGNATRCVAALLGKDCVIETAAGLLRASPLDCGATVDMGVPGFAWDEIPLSIPMDTRDMPVGWEVLERPTAVNMGNPHVVFFVEDIALVPLEGLGPVIEHDPLFPDRINVNVAQVIAPAQLAMRTWERGAGLTLACGTGACAVFAAARLRGLVPDTSRVDLPGGTLTLSERDGRIHMAGPATHVFSGSFRA